MNQYRDFAFVYDKLMDDVDYEGWINYIEQIIKNENAQVKNILELACGTGNITIPLAKKNYDIAGIDISDEMLNVARSKGEEQGIDLVLLEQDISELDFDVTNLDCVLCACDGFNYITYDEDLMNVFSKTYELLKEGNDRLLLNTGSLIKEILYRRLNGEDSDRLAYIFHQELARQITASCVKIREQSGCNKAALSGGVFQNRLLLELTDHMLKQQGFEVLKHQLVPPNDGGIALGQAVYAMAYLDRNRNK